MEWLPEVLEKARSKKLVRIVSGSSLDSMMASVALMDYLASSGVSVSLEQLSETPSLEDDQMGIALGCGFPLSEDHPDFYYVDYALRGETKGKCVNVVGSLYEFVASQTLYGNREAGAAATLDPWLSLGKVRLPKDLLPQDLYSFICPPIPGVVGSKEAISEGAGDQETLIKRAEALSSIRGFRLAFEASAERLPLLNASSVQRELFKLNGDSAAASFLIQRGNKVDYRPDPLLLEAIKQFLNNSDNWLTIKVKEVKVILLPGNLPSNYAMAPLIPSIITFGEPKPLSIVLEPRSEDTTALWIVGQEMDWKLASTIAKNYDVALYASGKRAWGLCEQNPIDLANSLEQQISGERWRAPLGRL